MLGCHFHHLGNLLAGPREDSEIRPAVREPFVSAEFLETALLGNDGLVRKFASQSLSPHQWPAFASQSCRKR